MSFLQNIQQQAKSDIKKIVLPEGKDSRILKAARYIVDNKIAQIVILGKEEEILEVVPDADLTGIEVIDYKNSDNIEKYAKQLYELRKHKGLDLDEAYELVKHCTYYGIFMLHNEEVDGMVSGATHSTADTLRPALQIIKSDPECCVVSTFLIMSLKQKQFGSDGIMLFADCGLIENPSARQLSYIAISSAKSFEKFVNDESRIAMLSYSTHGSAISAMTEKVAQGARIVKERASHLLVDGELQLDAAIIPEVAEVKAKDSPIKGNANILIFPDLNAGNIGYKLVERFGKAEAYGPITQGLRKPVNDLSRGSTVADIIGVISITAIQAQNM